LLLISLLAFELPLLFLSNNLEIFFKLYVISLLSYATGYGGGIP
jgi:hypothetical protein